VSVLTLGSVGLELGGRTVLEDVSLSIGAGEFTGLIGANGAGKTTLMKVVLGLLAPSRGSVQLGSDSSRIGYVPQKINLDPDVPLRARDLVALGLDGHRFGLRLRRRPGEAVERALAAVDAAAFADSRIGRLSGGEQQRVMIAHALVADPVLLVLDEPLANLDYSATTEIVSTLGRVCRQHGVAVLISAHDINPLIPVMDRVVYMAAGRATSGPAEEVVTTEVLTRLYRHPVEVLRAAGRIVVVGGGEGGHH
jgi:zinc/manganese transport system ATP-binding protein